MKIFKQVRDGIMSYPEAVKMIFTRGLWYYYLFPIVLEIALLWGGSKVLEDLKLFNFDTLSEVDGDYFILWLGIKCIFYFAAMNLTNYLVLALLSPLITRASYQTEYLLTGNTYATSLKLYLTDVDRAIRIIIRNMLLQLVWITGWYLVTIPFPSAWPSRWIFVFVVGSYFYGFSLMDYTAERQRLNIPDSVKFVRKNFILSWTLGSIYYLLFIIPKAGIVIAPITAIVAATIAVDKTVDLSKNPYAKQKQPLT